MNSRFNVSLRAVLGGCLIVLSGSPHAFGAKIAEQFPALKLRHREAGPNADRVIRPGEDATFTIKVSRNETAELVIFDPNTLFFVYKEGEVKEFQMPSFEALVEFTKVVQPDIDAAKMKGQVISIGSLSINTKTIWGDMQKVSAALSEIPNKLNASAKGKLQDDWPSDELDSSMKKLGDLIKFFDAIENAAATGSDLGMVSIDGGTPVTGQSFIVQNAGAELGMAYDAREKIRTIHTSVKVFTTHYKLAKAEAADGVPITFKNNQTLKLAGDGSKGKKVSFEIAKNTAYSSALNHESKAHQNQYSGTYYLQVEPLQTFHFRAGAGPIYSFVSNPSFSTETSLDGVITITEDESSSNKLGAAATLNIYLDRWLEEPVKPFAQIGYSPLKDTQGILGGIGLNAYSTQFSVGVIYQQRNTLKGGQAVGMTLANATDLGTHKEWAAGLYVQVSIELPTGK